MSATANVALRILCIYEEQNTQFISFDWPGLCKTRGLSISLGAMLDKPGRFELLIVLRGSSMLAVLGHLLRNGVFYESEHVIRYFSNSASPRAAGASAEPSSRFLA